LNLNPHFHLAVLDGVFIEKDGEIIFHKLPAPKTEEKDGSPASRVGSRPRLAAA
jgi:hypothetical protein